MKHKEMLGMMVVTLVVVVTWCIYTCQLLSNCTLKWVHFIVTYLKKLIKNIELLVINVILAAVLPVQNIIETITSFYLDTLHPY